MEGAVGPILGLIEDAGVPRNRFVARAPGSPYRKRVRWPRRSYIDLEGVAVWPVSLLEGFFATDPASPGCPPPAAIHHCAAQDGIAFDEAPVTINDELGAAARHGQVDVVPLLKRNHHG